MIEVILLAILMAMPIILGHYLVNRLTRRFLNNNKDILISVMDDSMKEEIDYHIDGIVHMVCSWYLIIVCFVIIAITMFISM